MVVFTCNHCGDSLQKPKVEKHCTFVCRAPKSLTCIDCLKDFRGEEYAGHTKCLTEDERYAAKGTYVNGIVKKGEVKQESWIEMIKSIIEKETNLKPSIRNLLHTISTYDNVPRKRPKFLNFLKSSSGGRANMNDVEEVWNIIEKYKEQSKAKNPPLNQNGSGKSEEEPTNNSNNETLTNGEDNISEGNIKKKKKRKSEITENIEMEESNTAEPTEEENVKKSKKKKKQHKDDVLQLETDVNIASEDNQESIKKKTKKKKLQDGEIQENGAPKKPKLDEETEQEPQKIKKKKLKDGEIQENGAPKKPKLDEETQQEPQKTKKKKLKDGEIQENGVPNKLKLNEESEQEPQKMEDIFDFKQKIIDVLTIKGSISKNKLEKKVVSAYLKHFGLSESSPKIIKKFNKKLKKIDNVEVVDEKVLIKTQ